MYILTARPTEERLWGVCDGAECVARVVTHTALPRRCFLFRFKTKDKSLVCKRLKQLDAARAPQ